MININSNPQTLYKAQAKTSSTLYSRANAPVAFQGKKEDNKTDKNTINLTPRQRQTAMAMLLTLATMITPACSNDESNNRPIAEDAFPERPSEYGTLPDGTRIISPAEMAALASRTPEGRAMVEQQMRNAEAERIRQDIREHNQRIREEASEQARIARERQMWDDKIRRMKINP